MTAEKQHQPLVSVLVAVYKTEPYIKQCLDSIAAQTYEHIEVIVVDDGTPDSAGKIADEYASSDRRFKVIHKENGGLSTARNAGLDNATGEFIVFVDSDDWLATDFVEYMMSVERETRCDLVISSSHFTSVDTRQADEASVRTMQPEVFIASYLYPFAHEGVWNKMYKKTLIEKSGARFRVESTTGEGMNFNTSVAQHLENIGVGDKRVYYYRIDNAGSATTKPNVERQAIGSIENINNIIDMMTIDTPYMKRALLWHKWHCHIYALTNIIGAGEQDKYETLYRDCKRYLRKHVMDAMRGDVSIKWKILDVARAIAPVPIITATVMVRRRFGRRK